MATPMDRVPRRELLKQIALSITALGAGSMTLDAGQMVHQAAAQAKSATGVYQPKLFRDHEYQTVARFAELIVPADEVSGSAVDAGAPEFIDLLCSQNPKLADIFTGGLAWVDAHVRAAHQTTFLDAGEAQQIALLESFVSASSETSERRSIQYEQTPLLEFRGYGVYSGTDLGPGVYFFDWIRKMSVDAFYTSPIGVKDLDYRGNRATSSYIVPQEAIDWALKHSPFA